MSGCVPNPEVGLQGALVPEGSWRRIGQRGALASPPTGPHPGCDRTCCHMAVTWVGYGNASLFGSHFPNW